MENLNKQNYFTPEWKAKYPLASEHFCKWIDEYKKRVNWGKLFNHSMIPSFDDEIVEIVPPKFHDLPIEMQLGILSMYMFESSPLYTECGWNWIGCPRKDRYLSDLEEHFNQLERALMAV